MKHIYISPHADDVALSCGGQIIARADHAADTLVVTVFTSDTAAGDLAASGHGASFADAVNHCRSQEDTAAWASLGVRIERLDLPEALLRGRFPFAIPVMRRDDALVDRLEAALRPYLARYPAADYHFPAGFGLHVDHLACRDAGLKLLDDGLIDQVLLYEEAPYGWLQFIRLPYYRLLSRTMAMHDTDGAIDRRDGLGLIAYLRRRSVPFPRGRRLFVAVWLTLWLATLRAARRRHYSGEVRLFKVGAADVRAKGTLLLQYTSQIGMLFGADADRWLAGGSVATEVTIAVTR